MVADYAAQSRAWQMKEWPAMAHSSWKIFGTQRRKAAKDAKKTWKISDQEDNTKSWACAESQLSDFEFFALFAALRLCDQKVLLEVAQISQPSSALTGS